MALPFQYGRSDSYRVATTQDKDEKESPKKKGGKDLDDLKKEVPIVCTLFSVSMILLFNCTFMIIVLLQILFQTKKKITFKTVINRHLHYLLYYIYCIIIKN